MQPSRLDELADPVAGELIRGDLDDVLLGGEDLSAASAWRALRRPPARGGQGPAARRAAMDAVDPRVVLRTRLARRAIERAQAGDPAEVQRLLDVLRRPFDEADGQEARARDDAAAPPRDAAPAALSCSSCLTVSS